MPGREDEEEDRPCRRPHPLRGRRHRHGRKVHIKRHLEGKGERKKKQRGTPGHLERNDDDDDGDGDVDDYDSDDGDDVR